MQNIVNMHVQLNLYKYPLYQECIVYTHTHTYVKISDHDCFCYLLLCIESLQNPEIFKAK